MSNHCHGYRLIQITHRLRTLFQIGVRVCSSQTYQLLAICAQAVRPVHATLADKTERLVVCHCPAMIHIVGSHGTIGILSNNNEAFLGTQHVHGFGSIRCELEFLPRFKQRFPYGQAIVSWDIDFKRELTSKRNAKNARRHSGDTRFTPVHELECINR